MNEGQTTHYMLCLTWFRPQYMVVSCLWLPP